MGRLTFVPDKTQEGSADHLFCFKIIYQISVMNLQSLIEPLFGRVSFIFDEVYEDLALFIVGCLALHQVPLLTTEDFMLLQIGQYGLKETKTTLQGALV